VHRVGDDDGRLAVGQEIVQFGVRGRGVDRHSDRARAKDGEVALERLHAVAQADHHPVAASHAEAGQVPGQAPGPRLQIAIGDRPLVVLEGDLLAEAVRVLPQHQGEGSDQFGAHGSHVLS
jgi:hypothetical protein